MTRRQRSGPGLWPGLACSLGAFLLGGGLLATGTLERLEAGALDLAYARLGPPSPPPGDMALLLIDSKSLLAMRSFWAGGGEEGLDPAREAGWPWHRFFFGVLVEFLHRAGARSVVLDLDLSGPSAREVDDDSRLAADFLRRAPAAFLALNFKEIPEAHLAAAGSYLKRVLAESDRVAAAQAWELRGSPPSWPPAPYQAVQVPFGPLAEPGVSRGMGFVNAMREASDQVRRVPLLLRYQGKWLPSLALAAARDALGAKEVEARSFPGGRCLCLDRRRIPVDGRGEMLLNWYGAAAAFPCLTIHETLKAAFADLERRAGGDPALAPLCVGWAARLDEDAVERQRRLFRGKTVLIGANAPELGDVYATPFSRAFPGVAVHATALANIVHDQMLRRAAAWSRWLCLAGMALAGGLGTALIGLERRGLLAFLAVAAVWLLFFAKAFQRLQWFDLVGPLLTLGAAWGSAALLDYFRSGRLKRKLRRTFDRVLQPALVDHLLEEPGRLALGGETRELTVLFTDLQNSTGVSERYPPGEWVDRLNRYFSAATAEILAGGGYLDKYIGDGIMAVWGAPVPIPDHAERAARTAVLLRERLARVEAELRAESGVELRTRMGLHTGPMLVGMVGGEGLAHYTVMGDTVNTASRLEGANKAYGTTTLMGEATWAAVRDLVAAREVDLVVLKGKSRPLRIFEPFGLMSGLGEREAELLRLYAEGLALYRNREWEAAAAAFARVLAAFPEDGPARVLSARCRELAAAPPPEEWQGEHVLLVK